MPDSSPHSTQIEKSISGAWPFISHISFQKSPNSTITWQSRHFRKGFLASEGKTFQNFHQKIWSGLWMPEAQNWWIGVLFMVGASFFMLGALFSLDLPFRIRINFSINGANWLFFFGSLFFTSAAWLQLFQTANRGFFTHNGGIKPAKFTLIGWQPKKIGWLSCFMQFSGTLLFNINTFFELFPGLNHAQSELLVWIPNLLGSILFLLSGYLAFIEINHKHWAWQKNNISWWLTFINLLGCITFLLSASYAYLPNSSLEPVNNNLSLLFTLIGATCFWIGAFLLLPENADPKTELANS